MTGFWRERRADLVRIPPPDPDFDVAEFRRKLAALPDVRVTKVAKVREAMAHSRYDEAAALERAIARLGQQAPELFDDAPDGADSLDI
jgi:hypothetical protein